MDREQIVQSAEDYVELEANTKVESIEVVEEFSHFGDLSLILTVETTDGESEFWVVAGETPTNLYPKSQFDNPDYVFSFHQGIMNRMAERQTKQMTKPPDGEKYDVFISHASEDKDEFVRPLVRELNRRGLFVWYDEDEVEIGDSIAESIDEGLAKAHCGAVVLSDSFFEKDWTRYELNGLTSRDIGSESRVVLPIWYKVGKKDVMKQSPALADKMAIQADGHHIERTAKELSNAIKSSISNQDSQRN